MKQSMHVMLHRLCRIMQAHGHPIGFVESVLFTSCTRGKLGKIWTNHSFLRAFVAER